MEVINRILETLNTITPESQAAVFKKCEEFSFNPDRGDVSMNESFINLNQVKDVLVDAIERQKINQLPLSIQKTILGNLESIKSFQASLTSGSDEVLNLTNSIEQLYANIWTFGFHHLSSELLGYKTKMNQLKEQEIKLNHLQKELGQGLELKTQLEMLVAQTTKTSEDIRVSLTTSQNTAGEIVANSDKVLKISQESAAHYATISQNDVNVTQLLANSKASNSEIVAMEDKIKTFFDTIDSHRKDLESAKESTGILLAKNNKDTQELISNLVSLESQIKDQIVRATGHSLFHSFQTRQVALQGSKKYWLFALLALVVASILLTIYIATSTLEFNIAFYLKLSASLPIVYSIAFCSVQYTRERKLEEEYAFKSNISISLLPYKELIEGLVPDTPEEKAKFAAFIIDSINKVFTSPTRRIFERDQSDVKPEAAVKQVTEMLDSIIKPLAPLFKK